MDDLISRGALIEQLEKQCGKNTYIIPDFAWETIENAPTAFNKEKVIEELTAGKFITIGGNTVGESVNIRIDRAVEIIEKGGIE